jgi:Uma2 family endonuclease
MSVPPSRRQRATYEDLLSELQRVPEHQVGEIIDGELVVSPRPAPRHTMASSALGAELGGPFGRGRGGPGGWWIFDEPELHFRPDVLVPDLAGWRRERLPTMPETAYFELVPDWVCEVISPSSARIDRVHKLRIYARERVRHAWLIDPIARTLEVFMLEGERWSLVGQHDGDELVRAPPFEAAELDLLALWGETRPPAPP